MTPEQWKVMSEDAHLILFDERRDPLLDRIDYCIVIHTEKVPMGYVTVREMDSESAYIGYGGVFPAYQKSVNAVEVYRMGMSYVREKYKRATTIIENKNTPMLKLAMRFGWLINGVRMFNGDIFLEHQIEFT